MSKVIAVVNHKGGVGKTTVTLELGAGLARKGNKVLLIDFDSQGNLTKESGAKRKNNYLEMMNGEGERTIFDALECFFDGGEQSISRPEEYILHTGVAVGLDIIPCNLRMAETRLKLNFQMGRETKLAKVVDSVKPLGYDYILIDNAPSIDIDFVSAIMAADEVLIVTAADDFSVASMGGLMHHIEKVETSFGKRVNAAGILINNADEGTDMAKTLIEVIRTRFKQTGVYDQVIPSSVKVKDAQAMQKSIVEYEPKDPVAIAFSSFIDEFIALEKWRETALKGRESEDTHGESKSK